jgi:hypothetical protein
MIYVIDFRGFMATKYFLLIAVSVVSFSTDLYAQSDKTLLDAAFEYSRETESSAKGSCAQKNVAEDLKAYLASEASAGQSSDRGADAYHNLKVRECELERNKDS